MHGRYEKSADNNMTKLTNGLTFCYLIKNCYKKAMLSVMQQNDHHQGKVGKTNFELLISWL